MKELEHLKIALLRCNWYTVEFTLLKWTSQWVLVYPQSCATISRIYFQSISVTPKGNVILISSHSSFSLLPTGPRWPLIFFLSLCICLFWAVHIIESNNIWSFVTGFLACLFVFFLLGTFLSFIYVSVSHYFLLLHNFPLCVYTTFHLSIHQFGGRYIYFLALLNHTDVVWVKNNIWCGYKNLNLSLNNSAICIWLSLKLYICSPEKLDFTTDRVLVLRDLFSNASEHPSSEDRTPAQWNEMKWGCLTLAPWGMVLWPVAPARNLLEIQTLRSHLDLLNQNLHFHMIPEWYISSLKFEKHCWVTQWGLEMWFPYF